MNAFYMLVDVGEHPDPALVPEHSAASVLAVEHTPVPGSLMPWIAGIAGR